MKNSTLKRIFQDYRMIDILESILVGVMYYILLSGIIVAPMITISALFVPYIIYSLLAMYIALAFIGNYAISKMIETLQHVQPSTHSFEPFHKRSSVILAVITFVIITIVYFVYLQ